MATRIVDLGAVVGPQGPQGPAGAPGTAGAAGESAKINGVNALTVQAFDGVKATQSGSVLTIKADKDVMASKSYVEETAKKVLAVAEQKIATVTNGSATVNVVLESYNGIVGEYKLNYSGMVQGNITVTPPAYYAFTGLAGTFLPHIKVGNSTLAGTLTSYGSYTFEISQSMRGQTFSFKSGEGHDYAILTMEVA